VAKYDCDIRTVLDIPLWEKVQDQIAALTGTSVICVDVKGVPVTKSSGQTEFCRLVRQDPVYLNRCYRCDALAGLEAMRLGQPYIYLCHCGIVDVAIPVILGDRYLGAVLFGQVRIPDNDDHGGIARLVSDISPIGEGDISSEKLAELYEKIPYMDYSQIVKIAELIRTLVHYVVERVMNNYTEEQARHALLSFSDKRGKTLPPDQDEEAKDEFEEDIPVSKSSAIYPTVAFVKNHLNDSITMKEMAALCHLSPSYFSRLFGRELGENFVSYVNRQKIQLAKGILRETNKSVSQIASELSYQDSSHFINLFKRFEGITPQVYRQYNCK